MAFCFLQSLSTKPSCSSALGPISTLYSPARLRTFESYSGNTGRYKDVPIGSGRSFKCFLKGKNSRGALCKINCEVVRSFCEALPYEGAVVQGEEI